MKAKDKKKNKIIITAIPIIILFVIIIVYNMFLEKNQAYSVNSKIENQNSSHILNNAQKIDIDAIIEKNKGEKISEEYRQEEVVLEYLTEYVTNEELAKGETYIIQEGIKGTQKIVYKKNYENGNIVEEQVSAEITKPAVKQIIEVGTGNKKTKQTIKIGDEVQITSDELTITNEPQEDSQKVGKVKKDNKVTVKKIQGDWYYIQYKNIEGWVKKEGTRAITIEEIEANQETTGIVQKLSFNMPLNKPSGLSLEQFQKILTDSKDKNKIFSQNAQYFYYIEKQYKINGVFVAAMAIHESAWGTSKIARDKNNLFGYGAYDSNPYNGAYQFSRNFRKHRLDCKSFSKILFEPKRYKHLRR